MQTFMTHRFNSETAKVLDDKRLGKQRVEAYQILKALRGEYDDTGAWVNHPATVMWRGHIHALAIYGYEMCEEWQLRGYDDSLLTKFAQIANESLNAWVTEPWWVNNELLHMTHRSNLIRKFPEYYGGWQLPSNIPYIWPLPEVGEFRLGTFKNGDNLDMLKGANVFLTSQQVAELLGVSPKTISAYKARGQMPKPDREYGRTPLWRLSTIQKWRGEIPTLNSDK